MTGYCQGQRARVREPVRIRAPTNGSHPRPPIIWQAGTRPAPRTVIVAPAVGPARDRAEFMMTTILRLPGVGEQGRPVERRTLHFDLSHLEPSVDYTLHACLEEHPLRAHTAETLGNARAAVPLLRALPDQRLTHFAELNLPSDAVALLSVTTPGAAGSGRLASMA